MTKYSNRKLKYSVNKKFNLLPYVEWDRFVTLTGAQAECGLRYRIYKRHSTINHCDRHITLLSDTDTDY